VVWTVAKGDIDCGSLGLLKGCFYAPDLQFNLLSVPHLNLTTGLVVCFNRAELGKKTDLRLYSKTILMLFWSSLDNLMNALIG
jgi:hypothetical protein